MRVDTLCIEITNGCPLRCTHCSAGASPQGTTTLPVPLLISKLRALNRLREVYLSGGEPFLHSEFQRLLEGAFSLSDEVVVYSSGVDCTPVGIGPLSLEVLVKAKRVGLARMDLSLYGATAKSHEAVTRTVGSFDATLETARRAAITNLAVGVHFVPIGNSASEVRAVFALARSVGAKRFHVLALAAHGRAGSMSHALALPKEFWSEVAALRSTKDCEVVLSSVIRRTLGRVDPTPRDALHAAHIDFQGYVYPGEGARSPHRRSQQSLLASSEPKRLFDEVLAAG